MSTLKAAAEGIYTALSVARPERLENAGFFALYFSMHKRRGVVLYIGTTPHLFRLFSFIQLHITGENQIGIAHRVMSE